MKNSNESCVVPIGERGMTSVSDIDVAATLEVNRFKVESIDRRDVSRIRFLFFRSPEVDQLIEGYWSNKVTVHPQEFAVARKNLKSRLFALKDIQY